MPTRLGWVGFCIITKKSLKDITATAIENHLLRIEMTIQLYLPGNGKTGTVHVRTYRGQPYVSTTKQRIHRKHWDKKKSNVRPNSAELIRLKERLERLVENLETFMIEPRTVDQFKERVRRVMDADGQSFYVAFDEFIAFKSKTLNKVSLRKYEYARMHINEFEELFDIKVEFRTINEDFGSMFYGYFQQIDLSPNYAGRLVGALKTFMKWAKKKEFHRQEEWEDLKRKAVKTPVNFMYGDELLRFANAPLVGTMANVRDSFIVGCFTALRYSDQQRIRPGHNQREGLVMSTQKDQDEVLLPISGFCKAILDRHDWRLPEISNFQYNQYLKRAAKEAGLDRMVRTVVFSNFKKVDTHVPLHEMISTHMARRTFVSISLSMKMPDEMIIRFTGHSSTDALKPYKGILDDSLSSEYRRVWSAA